MQTRNLEKVLDTEVLDRTGLILQIFALRARTREAKLQVESAQLQYMLPRLAGMRTNLSRQGGGSGRLSNKGAGEQKLELDRRRIDHRIAGAPPGARCCQPGKGPLEKPPHADRP